MAAIRRAVLAASLAVLAASLAVLAACASTPAPTAPTVRTAEADRVEVPEQTFTDFTAVAHLRLPAQVTARSASWELVVKDVSMAKGTEPLDVSLPAGGGLVQVRGKAPYAPEGKLQDILASTEPIPFLLRGAIEAAGAGGSETYSYTVAGTVRAPRVPEVKMWHVEAAAYHDQKELALVFFLELINANPFPVDVERIDYSLAVNDRPLVEKGVTGKNEKVPASASARLEFPLTLREKNFPDVLKFLKGAPGLAYKMDGEVKLALGRVPFELDGPIVLGRSAPEQDDDK